MCSQPYYPSRPLPASCTQLLSTHVHSTPQNATTMFTTKSYSLSMKHSNDGDTILKVPATPSMWSLITGISNTSPQPKSSRVDKHDGLNTFPLSTLSSISVLENLGPSLTLLLDDGTSILKRGIVTMPLSILRTTDPCSLPNSWHHPSKLLP